MANKEDAILKSINGEERTILANINIAIVSIKFDGVRRGARLLA